MTKSNNAMTTSFGRSTNMVAPGEDASQRDEIIDLRRKVLGAW